MSWVFPIAGAVGSWVTQKAVARFGVSALMSATGTVIPGVGTIHTATTAAVQAWAFGPIGVVTTGVGIVAGVAINLFM